MGASASVEGHELCSVCFDLGAHNPQLFTSPSSSCVHYRPITLSAWLSHWEINPLLEPLLLSIGVKVPIDATQLSAAHHRRIGEFLAKDDRCLQRWTAALSHVSHLREATSAYDAPGISSLQLWLESWRLGRLSRQFKNTWKCNTREDVLAVESSVAAAASLGMRPLEVRRWRRGQQLLRCGLPFDEEELNSLRPSSPTLETWLGAFDLSRFIDRFVEMGAMDVADLLAVDKFTLESLGFGSRELRQWKRAIAALETPQLGSGPPSLTCQRKVLWLGSAGNMAEVMSVQGWLERYHLVRLHSPLERLGAEAPVDLLDLSVNEVSGLGLR